MGYQQSIDVETVELEVDLKVYLDLDCLADLYRATSRLQTQAKEEIIGQD